MIREILEGNAWEFPTVVYRPVSQETNLPLILQLHGAGETGRGGAEIDRVERYGFIHALGSKKSYPCIFAMPQCPPDSFWVAELSNIAMLVRHLLERYCVDESRIYLTGVSMGGYGTWYTALRYPDLFAAIVPVCGGGMPWKAGVLNMPIWAFHGTEDNVVQPSESMNMIHTIRQAGHKSQEVKLTMLDGVAHNAWDYMFDEALLTWLLSKTKSITEIAQKERQGSTI